MNPGGVIVDWLTVSVHVSDPRIVSLPTLKG
jgi:hypothetical protein